MEGRVAIVTGGSSGFGRATAVRLAERGALVVVGDLDEAGGRETVELIGALGCHGDLVIGDVATADGAADLAARAVERFGGVDILVNNAGVGQEKSRTRGTGLHAHADGHWLQARRQRGGAGGMGAEQGEERAHRERRFGGGHCRCHLLPGGDESSYVTGQEIVVDGGLRVRRPRVELDIMSKQ